MISTFMLYQTLNSGAVTQVEDIDFTNLAHSAQFGGNGGYSFAETPNGKMTSIQIRHKSYIDAIGCTIGDKTTNHGGTGGVFERIDTRNLCINKVTVRSKGYVDSLTFHGFELNTYRSWQSKQFGGNGGKEQVVQLDGCLNGFVGRSKGYVDKIGFISVKEIDTLTGKWE